MSERELSDSIHLKNCNYVPHVHHIDTSFAADIFAIHKFLPEANQTKKKIPPQNVIGEAKYKKSAIHVVNSMLQTTRHGTRELVHECDMQVSV